MSYADLMTLLLAFFATMYAMSEVNADRATAPSDATVARAATPSATRPSMQGLRDRLAGALAEAIAAGKVDLYEDERGIVLSLPEGATFGVASADIEPAAGVLLTTITGTLAPLDAGVRVEGHTDDVPIRTPRYSSNWELSTARASAVVALFIARGIAPRRLAAAGYGQFHPRSSNQSPEGRARNRRVDIVVVRPASNADAVRAP